MKTVEDIKKILESKLLGDRRTDYSIWNISTYETNPYPFRISLSVPSGKRFADIASDFSFWKKSMLSFCERSGCRLSFENRKVPTTGVVVEIPSALIVPSQETAIRAVGRKAASAYALCGKRHRYISGYEFNRDAISEFLWKTRKRSDVDFRLLVVAADWISSHDTAGMTPRELPIPDMQGKLLNPKGDRVLVALLAGKVDLGLRDRPRKVEVRYLDTSSRHGFGLCVLDTGNDRNLAEPGYPCERAIIVENRDTFNSFPMEGIFSSNSVELLGNGNAGPSSIPQIPWLRTIHEIYYWGDMDTDGLEILARYRQAGLPCESILMTLDDFKRYEEYGTRYSKDNGQVFVRCEDEALAAFLTDAERGLYLALCGDSLKKNRIEQEKIPFQDALNYLNRRKTLVSATGSVNCVCASRLRRSIV